MATLGCLANSYERSTAMSTQNMPEGVVPEVQMATEEQVGHVLEMWKRRLNGRVR